MPRRIAVVTDVTAFLDLRADLLTEQGYDVHPFKEMKTARQGVPDLPPAAMILDVRTENDVLGSSSTLSSSSPCWPRRPS